MDIAVIHGPNLDLLGVREPERYGTQTLTDIRTRLERGPLRSVIVCKYSVPEITSALSRKSGMHVSRVSLKARNPSLSWPDAWEQKVLMGFDRRAAQGEKVESIEHVEVVREPQGRFLRYMKAIPTAAACLACHGPVKSLSDAMKAQIAGEYPHDKATGRARRATVPSRSRQSRAAPPPMLWHNRPARHRPHSSSAL